MEQLTLEQATNGGKKTIPEILDILMYASYASNRNYGATHEQLVKANIGNDYFREIYETKNANL